MRKRTEIEEFEEILSVPKGASNVFTEQSDSDSEGDSETEEESNSEGDSASSPSCPEEWVSTPIMTGIFRHCNNQHKEEKDRYCAACGTNEQGRYPKIGRMDIEMIEDVITSGMKVGKLEEACNEVYNLWNNKIRIELMTSVVGYETGEEGYKEYLKNYDPLPEWTLPSIVEHIVEHTTNPLTMSYINALKVKAIADGISHSGLHYTHRSCLSMLDDNGVLTEETAEKEEESDRDIVVALLEKGLKMKEIEQKIREKQNSQKAKKKKIGKKKRLVQRFDLNAARIAASLYVQSSRMIKDTFKTWIPEHERLKNPGKILYNRPGKVITSSMKSNRIYGKRNEKM